MIVAMNYCAKRNQYAYNMLMLGGLGHTLKENVEKMLMHEIESARGYFIVKIYNLHNFHARFKINVK